MINAALRQATAAVHQAASQLQHQHAVAMATVIQVNTAAKTWAVTPKEANAV